MILDSTFHTYMYMLTNNLARRSSDMTKHNALTLTLKLLLFFVICNVQN